MKEFLWALAIIFNVEGGWTEIDGGTKYGITAATLKRANGYEIVHTQNVRNISRREAAIIYHRMYWIPSKANRYPYPLNLVIFDAAVHMGPTQARKLLHKTLRKTFPIRGPQKITPEITRMIAKHLIIERYKHLQTLNNYPTYKVGWKRRMQKIMTRVRKKRKEVSSEYIFIKARQHRA